MDITLLGGWISPQRLAISPQRLAGYHPNGWLDITPTVGWISPQCQIISPTFVSPVSFSHGNSKTTYDDDILPDLKRLGLTYERDKRAKYDGKSTRGVVQGLRAVEEPPSAEWEDLQHQEQMHRKLMGYTPA